MGRSLPRTSADWTQENAGSKPARPTIFWVISMGKKILWLSRHNPLPSQISELKRIFGKDVEVVIDPQPFDNAEDIALRFKNGGYDEMVVVAPLSVIQRLTELGIKPLWAEMKRVSKEEAETSVSGRYYKFIKFKRIKGIKIEFEEL